MSAPTLVQVTFGGTASGSTLAVTFTATPAAGNMLKADVDYSLTGANVASDYAFTDTAGNSWNNPGSTGAYVPNNPGGGNTGAGDVMKGWVGNCLTHASNAVTVTETGGSASVGITLTVEEWSNILKVNNPARAVKTGSQSIGATTTPTDGGCPSAVGDLVNSCISGDNGQTAAASGWSLATNAGAGGFVDQYIIATGSTTTSTGAATDDGWAVVTVSFMPVQPIVLVSSPPISRVELPPTTRMLAGVIPSVAPVPASVVVTGGSPQRTTAFGTVTAPSLPPQAALPIPTIISSNGKGSGALDQTNPGFGQPAQPPSILESLLAAIGLPRLAELPPAVFIMNGLVGGALDNTATGAGKPAQPPVVYESFAGQSGPPQASLPPQPTLSPGVVPPTAPTGPTVLRSAPLLHASLPPSTQLPPGAGQAAQAPVVVTGAPQPPQATLPPQPELTSGAGQAAQPAQLIEVLVVELDLPAQVGLSQTAGGPGLVAGGLVDALTLGAGQPARAPYLLASAPPAPASLPPQPELEAGAGQAAQAPVVVSSAPPPPVAPLPPPTELVAGSPPAAAVAGALAYGVPAPSAALPPQGEITKGSGQAAQAPQLFASAPPPAAQLPPPQAVAPGAGQASQPAQLVAQAPLPALAPLPPRPELTTGHNAIIIPTGSTLYGSPWPASLPPVDAVIIGHGQAAQAPTLMQSAPPPSPALAQPELVVGHGQASQPAQLLVGGPPPALAALPPSQYMAPGQGQPAQVAVVLVGAPPPTRAPLPTEARLVVGAVAPSFAGITYGSVPLSSQVPLPPPTNILVGSGQAAQAPYLLRATFTYDTPPLLVQATLVAGFGGSPVVRPAPVRTILREIVVTGIHLRELIVASMLLRDS